MTTPGDRLDPDQVQCPTCGVDPGAVCRQPSGRRARAIHRTRRRAADRGEVAVPRAKPKQTRPGRSNLTPEDRAKGARASAQARRRRAAEVAARVEQQRAEAEAAALEAEAAKLAEDATRYARDRATLTRKVLDAATGATNRLIESLDGIERPDLDDEGVVVTRPVEKWDTKAERMRVIEVPLVRGWASADTIERLARSAAATLNSLRLEEGKPTGINRDEGSGRTAEVLGETGVGELLTWAADNLRRNPEP